LHVTTRDLLDLPKGQSITSLRIPPKDLPQWVQPELYVPYYMLKQLGDINAELWNTLFNRTEYYSDEEVEHLVEDLKPISESITAYKLWYYGNDIITEKYSDIFLIVNTDNYIPNTIHSSMELITELIKYMYDELIDSDSHIYYYSTKISIPPFILGGLDASQ
jgi:hypothetical protein